MGNLLKGLGILCLLLSVASCTDNKGSFLLVNNASEPIAKATVVICDQETMFRGINPTKSATGFYDVRADSHFCVAIEFMSGKKLYKEDGYVTNGFDYNNKITVDDNDIEIALIEIK